MSLSMSSDLLETVVSDDSDEVIRCAVLQGLDVYLDIESEVSGEISILRDILLLLGASVSSVLREGITHVVSNDCRMENCVNALHLKPHPLIVSSLWVLECNKRGMHVSEAPYMLCSLKEELELADGRMAKELLENRVKRSNKIRRRTERTMVEHVEKDMEQLSMAFQDIHLKPVAVRTKSTTLNDLQLMPSPPELGYRRKRVTHNIVASALSEISKKNLRQTIRKLGVYGYGRKVDERTKVLVADDEGTPTPNLLRALVLGVKIVRVEWVRDSAEKGCWLHVTSSYCVERWLPIYRRRGRRGLKRLLCSSCVFFASTGCSLPQETLKFLIAHAGGKVTNRISEADVVITHSRHRSDVSKIVTRRKPATAVVAQWLTDSILKGAMRPFDQYELELPYSTSSAISSRDSSFCCPASSNVEGEACSTVTLPKGSALSCVKTKSFSSAHLLNDDEFAVRYHTISSFSQTL
uniref:BRCT domain-containing protein n=1 Tax=Parascaris univalens TaxID=6257 RepID=A0A914ZUI9_PARUN